MLVTIAFHSGDKDQVVRLAKWMEELGGCKNHDILVGVYKDTNVDGLIEPLKNAFRRAGRFEITDDMVSDRVMYVYCANTMWKRTAQHVALMEDSQPWLWLEPDAVPLVSTWLDDIEKAYAVAKSFGKHFLLDNVKTRFGNHGSGVGVYPAKIYDFAHNLYQLANVAFDVFFKESFHPATFYTELIHDNVAMRPDPTFKSGKNMGLIRNAAVLFHRDKTGDLIERLREKKAGKPWPEEPEEEEEAVSGLMKIYTYHEDLSSAFDDPELMALSKESFRRQGFEMVVLGVEHAMTHPLFKKISETPALYMNGNVSHYLQACYRRYMAVSEIAKNNTDPMVMVDYDVINYGFTPEMLPKATNLMLMMADSPVPGMMIGNKDAYERILEVFNQYADSPVPVPGGLTHDQGLLSWHSDTWHGHKAKVLVEYPTEGWKKAPLVHYPIGRMSFNSSRGADIKRIRPLPSTRPLAGILERLERIEKHLGFDLALELVESGTAREPMKFKPMPSRLIIPASPANNGKERTPEQIQAAKDRMAKARAGRKKAAA
jgi:hypothetical protein